MGCGVSTFYCIDDGGLVKPQPPEDQGRSKDPKVVKDDVFSRQKMVSDEKGETCSTDSSCSCGCQSKVACVTMHAPMKNVEIKKARENSLVDQSVIKNEENRRNEVSGDTSDEQHSIGGDSEGEDEPWWGKGTDEFMRSPSFRDYCIIHYSSEDEEEDEDENEGNYEQMSNDKYIHGKGKTKVLDSNKKGLQKSRDKIAKRRPKVKKFMHKESSGSLRNILSVASCYSQSHSSKSKSPS